MKLSRNDSNGIRERARLGRCQRRPRRWHSAEPYQIVRPSGVEFGAWRTEQQPGRLRSPFLLTESFRLSHQPGSPTTLLPLAGDVVFSFPQMTPKGHVRAKSSIQIDLPSLDNIPI
ncbi:MAG: hypothetical protein DME21_02740 [Verrucomicrobia bacterium]|nr:MAG: hypothetical protein DME21_02740 [Verrucomicrobiota bacterium]